MGKALKYSIEKYNFKKGQYYGSVVIRGEDNLKDIFVKILESCEQKSLRDELERAYNYFNSILIEKLKEGYAVNINDYIILTPVLRGLFDGEEDIFDPKRHNIEIIAEPLKKIDNIKLKKIPPVRE